MRQNLIQAGGITTLSERCWQWGVWHSLSTDCSDVGGYFERLRQRFAFYFRQFRVQPEESTC